MSNILMTSPQIMCFRTAIRCGRFLLVLIGFCGFSFPLPAEDGGDNLHIGDLALSLRGSLAQSYDSNIGFSSEDPQSDWITRAGLQLSGEVELTEINTLRLSIGANYLKYWKNPEYDSGKNFINLTPDTEFELLFQIGNFDFRVYDNFSLLSEPGDQRFIDPDSGGQLTNIVLYNRIRNQVGLESIWTINPYWNANAEISRSDTIPLDDEFRNLERHSYIATLGLTHSLAANLDVYGQVSASIDRWSTDLQPGSSSWTAGAGGKWRMSDFLEWDVFLAWTHRSFDDDGNNQDPTRDSQGATGNIGLTHFINPVLQHSLRYSRDINLGTVSNGVTVQSAQYRIDYSGFERSEVFIGVRWNEGNETGVLSSERYNRWAFRTGLDYPLSQKLAFSSVLEHNLRDSSFANRDYSRTLISVTLTYDF